MGKNGDQDINFAQNRTLNEAKTNGVDVFLFEVVKEREYIYLGPIILYGTPYQEEQPGEDGRKRKVWIFPIKIKQTEEVSIISRDIIKRNFSEKQKKAGSLPDNEVKTRAEQAGTSWNKKCGV